MAENDPEATPPAKKVTPNPFMEAMRKVRLDSGKTQNDYATTSGVTFGTYSDWEIGRYPITHVAAEALVTAYIPADQQEAYRNMAGFPPPVRTSEEIITRIANEFYPGEPPVPLAKLFKAMLEERDDLNLKQRDILGTVEGSNVNNGRTTDESTLKKIVEKFGYPFTDEGIGEFYIEAKEQVEAQQRRAENYGLAQRIYRHYDEKSGNLNIPDPDSAKSVAAITLDRLSGDLQERGVRLTAKTLRGYEDGIMPNRRTAQAMAEYFNFATEAAFYEAANRLKEEKDFPDKTVSPPNPAAKALGKRIKLLRQVTGLTQDDVTALLKTSDSHIPIPDDFIKSLEKGIRKTAVSPTLIDHTVRMLGFKDREEFNNFSAAANDVMDVRKQLFSGALNNIIEDKSETRQTYGERALAEYESLQREYDASFRSYQADTTIVSWASTSEMPNLPEHPIMMRALMKAGGAETEEAFYDMAGVTGIDENTRKNFKTVADRVDTMYREILIPMQQGGRLKGYELSIFQPSPTGGDTGWAKGEAGQQRSPDGEGSGRG